MSLAVSPNLHQFGSLPDFMQYLVLYAPAILTLY